MKIIRTKTNLINPGQKSNASGPSITRNKGSGARASGSKWIQFLDDIRIAGTLDVGDRIYIAKRFLSYTGGQDPKRDKMLEVNHQFYVPFQVIRKPVWFSHGGNWSFRVTTNAVLLGFKNSRKSFEEQIFLNENNIGDFLFREEVVGSFVDKVPLMEYSERLRKKEEEELKTKQKEERAKKGEWAMAAPGAKPKLWKDC